MIYQMLLASHSSTPSPDSNRDKQRDLGRLFLNNSGELHSPPEFWLYSSLRKNIVSLTILPAGEAGS